MRDQITICICTLRRNRMLERLLRNLKLQETNELFDISVVVVDNDAEASARETVMRLRGELNLETVYEIEPEQTIPAARNRALSLARGNFIGIIDDDEFPPSHWLITMYRAIEHFGADGALGPVLPFFDQEPPSWLLKGRFCERPVYRTGTPLKWNQTRTGNVVLKKRVFDEHNLLFDLKWKTSGSDQAFFRQAMGLGYRFIAVAEAPVYEIVPPERWTKSYYIKRSLVHGYNSYRYTLGNLHGPLRVFMALRSFIALLFYAISLPVSFFWGTDLLVKSLEKGSYHLSYLLAMFGIELVKKRGF